MLESIAVIPDGNRRYAKKSNLSLLEAYEKGFSKAEEFLDWCLEKGIKEVTMWAFSTENLKRPKEELSLLERLFSKHLSELAENEKVHRNKVKVRIIGMKEYLSKFSKEIKKIKTATKDYSSFVLNIALGYGGKEELLTAFKQAVSKKPVHEITEQDITENLYVKKSPDLIIRTGGYQRLSGYLLWQSAYSELFFSKKLWPEFSRQDFEKAIEFYSSSKRNFGK